MHNKKHLRNWLFTGETVAALSLYRKGKASEIFLFCNISCYVKISRKSNKYPNTEADENHDMRD